MSRNPRKDLARKRRLRRRNEAWAARRTANSWVTCWPTCSGPSAYRSPAYYCDESSYFDD